MEMAWHGIVWQDMAMAWKGLTMVWKW